LFVLAAQVRACLYKRDATIDAALQRLADWIRHYGSESRAKLM
jgi:hypothetical protein